MSKDRRGNERDWVNEHLLTSVVDAQNFGISGSFTSGAFPDFYQEQSNRMVYVRQYVDAGKRIHEFIEHKQTKGLFGYLDYFKDCIDINGQIWELKTRNRHGDSVLHAAIKKDPGADFLKILCRRVDARAIAALLDVENADKLTPIQLVVNLGSTKNIELLKKNFPKRALPKAIQSQPEDKASAKAAPGPIQSQPKVKARPKQITKPTTLEKLAWDRMRVEFRHGVISLLDVKTALNLSQTSKANFALVHRYNQSASELWQHYLQRDFPQFSNVRNFTYTLDGEKYPFSSLFFPKALYRIMWTIPDGYQCQFSYSALGDEVDIDVDETFVVHSENEGDEAKLSLFDEELPKRSPSVLSLIVGEPKLVSHYHQIYTAKGHVKPESNTLIRVKTIWGGLVDNYLEANRFQDLAMLQYVAAHLNLPEVFRELLSYNRGSFELNERSYELSEALNIGIIATACRLNRDRILDFVYQKFHFLLKYDSHLSRQLKRYMTADLYFRVLTRHAQFTEEGIKPNDGRESNEIYSLMAKSLTADDKRKLDQDARFDWDNLSSVIIYMLLKEHFSTWTVLQLASISKRTWQLVFSETNNARNLWAHLLSRDFQIEAVGTVAYLHRFYRIQFVPALREAYIQAEDCVAQMLEAGVITDEKMSQLYSLHKTYNDSIVTIRLLEQLKELPGFLDGCLAFQGDGTETVLDIFVETDSLGAISKIVERSKPAEIVRWICAPTSANHHSLLSYEMSLNDEKFTAFFKQLVSHIVDALLAQGYCGSTILELAKLINTLAASERLFLIERMIFVDPRFRQEIKLSVMKHVSPEIYKARGQGWLDNGYLDLYTFLWGTCRFRDIDMVLVGGQFIVCGVDVLAQYQRHMNQVMSDGTQAEKEEQYAETVKLMTYAIEDSLLSFMAVMLSYYPSHQEKLLDDALFDVVEKRNKSKTQMLFDLIVQIDANDEKNNDFFKLIVLKLVDVLLAAGYCGPTVLELTKLMNTLAASGRLSRVQSVIFTDARFTPRIKRAVMLGVSGETLSAHAKTWLEVGYIDLLTFLHCARTRDLRISLQESGLIVCDVNIIGCYQQHMNDVITEGDGEKIQALYPETVRLIAYAMIFEHLSLIPVMLSYYPNDQERLLRDAMILVQKQSPQRIEYTLSELIRNGFTRLDSNLVNNFIHLCSDEANNVVNTLHQYEKLRRMVISACQQYLNGKNDDSKSFGVWSARVLLQNMTNHPRLRDILQNILKHLMRRNGLKKAGFSNDSLDVIILKMIQVNNDLNTWLASCSSGDTVCVIPTPKHAAAQRLFDKSHWKLSHAKLCQLLQTHLQLVPQMSGESPLANLLLTEFIAGADEQGLPETRSLMSKSAPQ